MGYNPGPDYLLKQGDEHNLFGYYECLPLMRISKNILNKFGGDIVKNIPDLPDGWMNELSTEKRQILDIVHSEKIEVVKDASILVIADLYHELFPKAKWIVTQRDECETFRSRFGFQLTYQEWLDITNNRLRKWQQTYPYSKALHLNYNDFAVDLEGTISCICSFLEVELTALQIRECMDFFKPGQRSIPHINR